MGETKSDIGTERASFIPKAILEDLFFNFLRQIKKILPKIIVANIE